MIGSSSTKATITRIALSDIAPPQSYMKLFGIDSVIYHDSKHEPSLNDFLVPSDPRESGMGRLHGPMASDRDVSREVYAKALTLIKFITSVGRPTENLEPLDRRLETFLPVEHFLLQLL